MMQFCNKCDDAIWLDDEWTPEKYRGFTTNDFNKIVEGNMNASVPFKGASAVKCVYRGWTLLLSNYAPFAMLRDVSSGVVAKELRRRFAVYGLSPIAEDLLEAGYVSGHMRELIDSIGDEVSVADAKRIAMTGVMDENTLRVVWNHVDRYL